MFGRVKGTGRTCNSDAVLAITRDYLDNPDNDRRAQWRIEAGDPPSRSQDSREDLTRRRRAARTWINEQCSFIPTRISPPNEIADPYPVPQHAYGWSAADASYALGAYQLAPGQALFLDGYSPVCVISNLYLLDPFLPTHDYPHDRCTC